MSNADTLDASRNMLLKGTTCLRAGLVRASRCGALHE